MKHEWIVRHLCHPPLQSKPVAVIDVFDDEDCLAEFCREEPSDILEVLELRRSPLIVFDVTEYYVPGSLPDRFDREASRADQQRDELVQGARV